MSDMVEVKTADLSGYALDWAVAKVEGIRLEFSRAAGFWHPADWPDLVEWAPSTDWGQCGPLIEERRLEIIENEDGWAAVKGWICGEIYQMYPVGETHLVAACRAIVAEKLGDTVQVPEELML